MSKAPKACTEIISFPKYFTQKIRLQTIHVQKSAKTEQRNDLEGKTLANNSHIHQNAIKKP